MMIIDNKIELGSIVYLKTDKDQLPRIVVRISISINGIMYELACGSSVSLAL
jgi:hypothetical protein